MGEFTFGLLTVCVSIVSVGYTSEALLAGGVPYLQFHFGVIYGYYFVLENYVCIVWLENGQRESNAFSPENLYQLLK